MSLGGLLIVLSVASDPFIQQVVAIATQPNIIRTSDINVPKAQNYTLLPKVGEPTPSMVAAINVGFSVTGQSKSFTLLPFSCPQGNCDYDEFDSLAVCSRCADMTSRLAITNLTYSDSSTNKTYPGTEFSYMGLSISNSNGKAPVNTWNVTEAQLDQLGPLDDLNIASFLTFNVTDPTLGVWPQNSPKVELCSLFFCIQSIQSSVRNGILSETATTKTAAMLTQNETNGAFHKPIIFYDVSAQNQQYAVAQGVLGSIWAYFAGTIMEGGEAYNMPSIIMQESGNISQVFEGVALAMTQEVRRNADGAPKVQGETVEQISVIQVRWEWLILPLINTLGGVVFLILTIRATSRANVPLWKEEILATLLHGLAPCAEAQAAAGLATSSSLGEYAKDARARLRKAPDGGVNLALDTTYTLLNSSDSYDEGKALKSRAKVSIDEIASTEVEEMASRVSSITRPSVSYGCPHGAAPESRPPLYSGWLPTNPRSWIVDD